VTAGVPTGGSTGVAAATSAMAGRAPLLSVRDLAVHFPHRSAGWRRSRAVLKAVDGVSIDVWAGETLGLVGESGCGKTTTGRAIVRLLEATAGSVTFDGEDVSSLTEAGLQTFRRRVQMIFQDPLGSLNPRLSIGSALEEVLHVHGLAAGDRRGRVVELLERVGLGAEHLNRYPHEFSGGQCQRIGIARALCLRPDLLVLDEPVSALDVSVRSQVLNLLADLQQDMGLTYVFIAHDLDLVEHISDRVAVMYLGRIVEIGETEKVYLTPRHPYTAALLSARPRVHAEGRRRGGRIILKGDVPSPVQMPPGCLFHPRCPHPGKDQACVTRVPPLTDVEKAHFVACPKAPEGA